MRVVGPSGGCSAAMVPVNVHVKQVANDRRSLQTDKDRIQHQQETADCSKECMRSGEQIREGKVN
jgi:hypothetical protein